MKPRIFVSSTFYDLKYIREDLSNFIKAHDFEPIMFEDGDIGYTPGRPLDDSCYETMKSADMVLLIIGGNYGSPATGEAKDEFKEYMSVTRNEFKRAVNNGIPLYAFIDNKVYAEFEVYEANYEKIEIDKESINFRNTKDINVFRFIREIKSIGHISMTEFEKAIQIKDFLSKQWSDMFKRYLEMLRDKNSNMFIENSVNDLRLLIEKMSVMLDGVGKKILSNNDSKEYEEVIELQNILMLASRITEVYEIMGVSLDDTDDQRRKTIDGLLLSTEETLEKNLWNLLIGDNLVKEFFETFIKNGVYLANVDIGGDKRLEGFLEICKDSDALEVLKSELIKNENYIRLIHERKKS